MREDANTLKLDEKQKMFTIPTSNKTANNAIIPKIVLFKTCILNDLYQQSQCSKT